MKYTKLYYYKPKTAKSITLISYTKLYCLKTTCHKQDLNLFLIICILTGLNWKLLVFYERYLMKNERIEMRDHMIYKVQSPSKMQEKRVKKL